MSSKHRAAARRPRGARSAFSAMTTAALKPVAFVATSARGRRAPARSAAPTASSRERSRARVAPFEVRADRNLIADRQLAVVKCVEPATRRGAGEGSHAVLASFSSARSACARAGQARFDGADGDAERKGNLFVTQAVDFAQDDRRALIERQPVERRLQPRRQLLLGEDAVGRRFARRQEIAVGGDVLVERHLIGAVAPAPEAMAVARLVDGDAIDPGAQARWPRKRSMVRKTRRKTSWDRSSASSRSPSRFTASCTTMRWCSATSSAQAASSPRGAPLHERSFPTADVRPTDDPRLLHQVPGE